MHSDHLPIHDTPYRPLADYTSAAFDAPREPLPAQPQLLPEFQRDDPITAPATRGQPKPIPSTETNTPQPGTTPQVAGRLSTSQTVQAASRSEEPMDTPHPANAAEAGDDVPAAETSAPKTAVPDKNDSGAPQGVRRPIPREGSVTRESGPPVSDKKPDSSAQKAGQPATTPETIRARVEARLADVPFRTPIVDDYDPSLHKTRPGENPDQVLDRVREREKQTKTQNEKIDTEWGTITAAARKSILSNPEARQAAARFASEPLSEALPERAINDIAAADRRTHVAQLLSGAVSPILKLEQIPDELLKPDLPNAPSLIRKDNEVNFLVQLLGDDDTHLDEGVSQLNSQIVEQPGITEAERELVARRYRYAREVKLLALMAELHDQPMEAPGMEDGGVVSHELSSGTKIVMNAEAFETTPALVDPRRWESRTYLKDRVHTVIIDGERYIMKERKTPRHMHVKKYGHIDGLASEQEFGVAREFAGLGTIRQGDVELHWEEPLAYVKFRDGYQFCLFKAEPGLVNKEGPIDKLTREILASPDEYHDEYEQVAQRAQHIYRTRTDLLPGYGRESRTKRILSHFLREQPKPDELTFEEFAELHAHYIARQAIELLTQVIWDNGYTNSDMDGYALRVRSGTRPTLEIIGFDFEYYEKDPERAMRIAQNFEDSKKRGDSAYGRSYRTGDTRKIMLAASLAMLERMGWELPPPR